MVALEFIRCLNEYDPVTFRRITDAPFTVVAGMNQPFYALTGRINVDQYYQQIKATTGTGFPIEFKRQMSATEFAKTASPAWKTVLEKSRTTGVQFVIAQANQGDYSTYSVVLAVCIRGLDVQVIALQMGAEASLITIES